jgi:hypothetical protein
MTVDELRAACEHLQLAACDPAGPLYGSDLVPAVDDVTGHLLAELDPTPADAAWMKSIPEPAQSHIPSWRDYGGHGFEVFVRLPGNQELRLENPTRGQIVKLLAVYGISLLES